MALKLSIKNVGVKKSKNTKTNKKKSARDMNKISSFMYNLETKRKQQQKFKNLETDLKVSFEPHDKDWSAIIFLT